MKKPLIIILILFSFASQKAGGQFQSNAKYLRKPSVAYAKWARQGFNMKLWISNQMALGSQAGDGSFFCGDLPCPFIGLEYPEGSGIEHLFGAGPWLGGIINRVRRVTEGYNGDSADKFFLPNQYHPLRERMWFTSTLNTDEPNRRYFDDDNDGRVDEDDLDGLDNDGDWAVAFDDVGSDGIPDSLETGCKGGFDKVINPDPAFDNYDPDTLQLDECHPNHVGNFRSRNDRDLYTEKNGIPDNGEPHVDEDYAAVSESDYYCSATDTVAQGNHVPMGVKIIQKSYAWSSSSLDAILPFEYTFVNIGNNIIHDVYLAFFADIDIGPINVASYFQHNFVCYDESLRLVYGHNPIDRGSTPLGLIVLDTPRDLDSLKYIFRWFDFTNNLGPGTQDSNIYNWMNGTDGFLDPVMPCQSPTATSDTRFFFSFGPFEEFSPGDSLKFSVAFVSGFGVGIGPNNMKENAVRAMAMYNRDYFSPAIPPSPKLKVTTEKHRSILEWGSAVGYPDPLESFDRYNGFIEDLPDTHWRRRDHPDSRGGKNFEGFKVWRSASPTFDSTSFSVIAQYDVDDDLNVGSQTGLKFSYTDSLVRTGNEYWYAVTSYSIPTAVRFKIPFEGGGVETITHLIDPVESALRENAQQVRLNFGPSTVRNEVMVVPNPYRGDVSYTDGEGFEGPGYLWNYSQRAIKFINLPERATIRIFTVAGDVITTIRHDDNDGTSPIGEELWRLFSESDRPITGGIYVYSVESELGTQVGKFVIMK